MSAYADSIARQERAKAYAAQAHDPIICPKCDGNLDTGFECLGCGYDAAPVTRPATSQEGEARCPASPDHADIKETIEDAADDWQAQGYTSALAEVRDMAAVGRSLMEALPKGYCYMDSPAEIVSDLQNDLDEALAATPTPPTLSEDLRKLIEALEPFAAACNISTADDSESLYDSLAAEKLTWRDLRRARAALARAQVKAS